ncbi:MAG: hypothetical protein COA59_00305 [Colwellia sp.]|jgi:hypothetical protein|nr:MAG: hypothetical protein COA59_00305 [Colwellia sp.]
MESIKNINNEFSITDVDITFNNLSEIYGDLTVDLTNKNTLSLPVNGYFIPDSKEQNKNTFHTTIDDVYEYFSQSEELAFDVYSDDEDINYLSLHSDSFWLGTFIISSVISPVFIGLLTNYIYDKLKAKKEDQISIEVIVDSGTKKSKSIRFRGKVEGLDKAIEAINKLND